MAKVHTSNKRPRIEDPPKQKTIPGFYQDFPEVLQISVTALIKSKLPLTFMEWPDYLQSGLVVSVLGLMRDTPDLEARALISRYWEVRLAILSLLFHSLIDVQSGPWTGRCHALRCHQRSLNQRSPSKKGNSISVCYEVSLLSDYPLTVDNGSLKRVSRAIKSWQTLMAKLAGQSDTILVRRSLAKFLLDCLLFFHLKCLESAQVQLGTSKAMLILPGPDTCESQQIPELPQLIKNTIVFLSETAQPSLTSYKPIPRPTAGASPTLPVITPLPKAICNSTGMPSADVCTERITASGGRLSNEEGIKDFASMVKACIVPRPKGSDFLKRMACNSHVKKAAYHLFELPKLLAGSKVNWEHSGPHGILLHGPPGTGKTSLAEAMAFDAQYTFFKVPASLIRSCLVGNSEK